MKSQILTILILLITFNACENPKPTKTTEKAPEATKQPERDKSGYALKPKNIILMVGDGMGLTQITAGMYMNKNFLNLERMEYIGLSKTYAADNLVTDSAAGATAFACGKKTYNGAIGVDVAKKPLKTILELAEDNGLSTGMVATCVIQHATPGSFIAHVDSRHKYEEITEHFLNTPIDIFIGGGQKHFDERVDKRNLLDSLRNLGYQVIDTTQTWQKEKLESDKVAIFTASVQPKPIAKGRKYLKQAATTAIDFLNKSDKGFFLMIEGSQIDWGGHANKIDYVVTEMLDFDKTIKEVIDFVEEDKETLLIITADHETGGLAINAKSIMNKNIEPGWTTDYHTATMVPVFALGPGAENFKGIYENTDIFHKMKKLYGF